MEIIRCKAFWWIVAALVLLVMQDVDAKSYGEETLHGKWEMIVGCQEEKEAVNYVVFSEDMIECRLDFCSRKYKKVSICILKKYINGFEILNNDSMKSDSVEIVGENLIIFNLRAFKRFGTVEEKTNINGLAGKWKTDDLFESRLNIQESWVSSGDGPMLKIVDIVKIDGVRIIKVLGGNRDVTYSLIINSRDMDSIVMFVGAPAIMQGPTVFFRENK